MLETVEKTYFLVLPFPTENFDQAGFSFSYLYVASKHTIYFSKTAIYVILTHFDTSVIDHNFQSKNLIHGLHILPSTAGNFFSLPIYYFSLLYLLFLLSTSTYDTCDDYFLNFFLCRIHLRFCDICFKDYTSRWYYCSIGMLLVVTRHLNLKIFRVIPKVNFFKLATHRTITISFFGKLLICSSIKEREKNDKYYNTRCCLSSKFSTWHVTSSKSQYTHTD